MSAAAAPDEHARPVVVYDGDCAYCNRQVRRIRRRDPGGRFEYASRHQPGLEQRFPMLAAGDFNTGMRLIEPDGTIRVGADAVHGVARRLSPWKWLAWLYLVPGLKQLFRAVYAWIARNRHRLGGACEDEVCVAPGGDETDPDARG